MVCKMVPGDNTPAVSNDSEEIHMALIVVQDMTSANMQVKRLTFQMASTAPVSALLNQVASSTSYVPDTFELGLQRASAETIVLNEHLDKTLEAVGFVCDDGATRNNLIIADRRTGNSSSPPVIFLDPSSSSKARSEAEEEEETAPLLRKPPSFGSDIHSHQDSSYTSSNYPVKRGFVGLVNQAMTCYLNSLIQTLFMTPEFRNALYRWRFDGTEEEQAKSIPFQLQSLFLKLQTTDKPSIGTTQLTRSFGWDSSEAWQQHDIQELCRVMFDALEHKFRRTEQADLISRLYEGKMMDYVRCLECQTEKAREDTFLDIPLPVRPFGSQTAYSSIEEALKAFVTPETLDGNNQYLCDRCGKKCDAHKGLKFSRFPYLLTLHLKRFDFDYTTLHRVKLNDKVTFPEFLNLDAFLVDPAGEQQSSGGTGSGHNSQGSKSGGGVSSSSAEQAGPAGHKDSQDTAIEDSMSEASESSRANSSSNGAESQDDDEGIDVRTEGCASSTSGASGVGAGASASDPSHQNRKNSSTRDRNQYELFSIMIHSGSASGGHYYAYIKDFPTGEWHCFNDQTVSRITHDDIRKTYGGGPSRSTGYFTSAFTSSTNAYMLMYREINKERNANFMGPSEFPEHLQQLLGRLKEEEECARVAEEQERNTCRVQLYCHHPKRGRVDYPFRVHRDTTLRQAVSLAYDQIGDLQDVGIGLDRCRLVKYNQFYDSIECSWDHRLDETVDRVFGPMADGSGKFDLLLEVVAPGRAFEKIEPDSLTVRLVMIDVVSGELGAPIILRVPDRSNVRELKLAIKSVINLTEDLDSLHLVSVRYSETRHMIRDDWKLEDDCKFHHHRAERVYGTIFTSATAAALAAASSAASVGASSRTSSASDEELEDCEYLNLCKPRFYDLIDQYENALTVRLTLPKVDRATLDRLGIPGNLDTVQSPSGIGSLSTTSSKPWLLSEGPMTARPSSPVMMEQCEMVESEPVVEDLYSPDDDGGDVGSDDSLSHLERERALSEGEEEEDVELFVAGTDEPRRYLSKGDEMHPVARSHHQSRQQQHQSAPRNSALSSASEDSSSRSLTDSDRTLLGHPPEMDEGFVQSEDESRMRLGQPSPSATADTGASSNGRRNALTQQVQDMEMDDPLSPHSRAADSAVVATDSPPLKYFFKVIDSSEEDAGIGGERQWTALVDKRIPLTAFKTKLQGLLNVPAEYLLVYRKMNSSGGASASPSVSASPYTSGEREWVQPNETLETLGEDPHVVIRLGRALKEGEYRGKIFQLCINPAEGEERIKFLFDWVLSSGIPFGQLKRDILAEVKARYGLTMAPEKCILRKKVYRTPSTVYGDEDELLDTNHMYIYKNWEMYLQLLDRPDLEAEHFRGNDICLFTRRWRPSTLTLEEMVDTPLPATNRTALARFLTAASGLPADQIEIAKASNAFPCEGSLLAIQEELAWIPLLDEQDQNGIAEFRYPCYVTTDGEMVYWREKGEPLKKLTDQERRELSRRDQAGSDASASATTTSYSPRKERPLRILLDSPCVSKVDSDERQLRQPSPD